MIGLDIGVGVDCSFHRDGWKGVAPAVEIVCADFTEVRQLRKVNAPLRPGEAVPFDAEPGDIVTSQDGRTVLRVFGVNNDDPRTFDGECLTTGELSGFWLKANFSKRSEPTKPTFFRRAVFAKCLRW